MSLKCFFSIKSTLKSWRCLEVEIMSLVKKTWDFLIKETNLKPVRAGRSWKVPMWGGSGSCQDQTVTQTLTEHLRVWPTFTPLNPENDFLLVNFDPQVRRKKQVKSVRNFNQYKPELLAVHFVFQTYFFYTSQTQHTLSFIYSDRHEWVASVTSQQNRTHFHYWSHTSGRTTERHQTEEQSLIYTTRHVKQIERCSVILSHRMFHFHRKNGNPLLIEINLFKVSGGASAGSTWNICAFDCESLQRFVSGLQLLQLIDVC